jgi:putative hydrolase of the HAD superfamily
MRGVADDVSPSDPVAVPLTSRPKPTIVCFDLGGVLVRICHDWDDACRAAGVDLRTVPSSPGIDARLRDLLARLGTGEISLDEWAEGTSQSGGGTYNPAELIRVHHAITREERPGALALVDELHRAGVVTACLSNTNESHWTRLVHRDANGPLDGAPEYPAVARLMHQFASHRLHLAKPDAAIYAHVERVTGTRGSDVLFFDDTPENVAAALRRGWRAERVDPAGDTVAQMRMRLRAEGLV